MIVMTTWKGWTAAQSSRLTWNEWQEQQQRRIFFARLELTKSAMTGKLSEQQPLSELSIVEPAAAPTGQPAPSVTTAPAATMAATALRIAELEQVCGQLAVENAGLKIALAHWQHQPVAVGA